jgi:hypothetical protein
MNKRIFKYCLLLLLLGGLSGLQTLVAQESYPAESVRLWSDRKLYFASESVLFTGFLTSNQTENIVSEVVYVELITPDGQKINQAKLKLVENSFNGEIYIPEDILSGYYFLRAYTKWMRNGNPQNYAYVRLKLLNYENDELLEVNDSLVDHSEFYENTNANPNPGFSLNKETYSQGEKLRVSMDTLQFATYLNTCLSIIPSVSNSNKKPNSISKNIDYSKINFFPETRGLSLSGVVVAKQNRNPLPYQKVNVHIEGEKDIVAVLSDTAGRFYMALPERYKIKELFVIAGTLESTEIEVLIDNDFCNKNIHLKVPSFSINQKNNDQILQMAQSAQLDNAYRTESTFKQQPIDTIPFYGIPYKTIDFDKFVPLDSLQQYFTDIPSWVRVKESKGKRKILLAGPQPDLLFYEPLILVDWVPVDDAERVLAIAPQRIKKFDVVISPYIHGGIIYGGIVSIITRNNDYGGFDFPSSGMYINFDFYNFPYFNNAQPSTLKPFKNTYAWVPSLKPEQSLEFDAPKIKGEYILLLQSIDETGNQIINYKSFIVD